MQQEQEFEKSGGEQSRRSGFWIRLRSWGNSIVDLAVYIGRQSWYWLRKISGGTDPRKQVSRAVVLGAVVVATVGGVLMYFDRQVTNLRTQVQQFSSYQVDNDIGQLTSGESVPSTSEGFRTGKVELGLSEEELVKHMDLEGEEAATALARSSRQFPEANDELSEEALGALNLSKLIWPVQGTVRTGYGWWRHPLYRDWRVHTGLAIATPVGSTVHAALPGRVVDIYHDNYLRTVVVLEHGGQVRTLYGNLQEVAVTLGASVSQGRVLGRAAGSIQDANVGEAYFEVRHRGQAIDPLPYLR